MNMDSILKKEGIEIVKPLDILQTNKIANTIANKLCNTFPEHDFNKKILFSNLARLDMYIAKMPEGLSLAKYSSENHSIYFNEIANFESFDQIAMHECIHFLQEDKLGSLALRLGLATFSKKPTGIALNEAAVQLMASEANHCKQDEVTYYGITLPTISPNYYTLECVLVNQMAYFTGTYPLYHSTLMSNDVFKQTFIAKSNKKTFYTIQANLDKLVELEDLLCQYTNDLQSANANIKKVSSIHKAINTKKQEIFNTFFKTQNLIMTTCFHNEFNTIRNLDDLAKFKSRLYHFQYIIGTNKDYTFYNDFYYYTMTRLEKKQEYIEQHSKELLSSNDCTAITLFEENNSALSFFKKLLSKLKKLGQLQKNHTENKQQIN